jgi:hypothetical protein
MANGGHTIEDSVLADISGYVPALALPERGYRQEARYKLRSCLRKVTHGISSDFTDMHAKMVRLTRSRRRL